MLKKSAFRKIVISSLSLFILLIIYLFPNKTNNCNETEKFIDAIKLPIYLVDDNNLVARTNVLKENIDLNSNIKYIINSLTINTKESSYISDNFNQIIPKNTKLLDLSLDNKILKLNFSKEILNIEEKNERKLIESLIFSLCEFKEVEEIIIFVEGKHLSELPNSKRKIPPTLNKKYGINKTYDLTSFKNTKQTINYYIAKNKDETYYVPISKNENNEAEKIEVIIDNLKTSPINQTNLISYLKVSATLDSYEILEESVSLSFDNNIIADLSSKDILEEVKYSIYLSVRDTYNTKSVIFDIPNEKNVSVILD